MQNNSYDSRMERGIADLSEAVGQQREPAKPQKGKIPIRTMPTLEDITGKKVSDAHPLVQSANGKEFVHQMVEKISRHQPQDRSSKMPSFNLADKILAQQRKIAALKRKSPLENNNQPPNQPKPVHISSVPPAPASPQQKIIADIVAKEIMALSAAR